MRCAHTRTASLCHTHATGEKGSKHELTVRKTASTARQAYVRGKFRPTTAAPAAAAASIAAPAAPTTTAAPVATSSSATTGSAPPAAAADGVSCSLICF